MRYSESYHTYLLLLEKIPEYRKMHGRVSPRSIIAHATYAYPSELTDIIVKVRGQFGWFSAITTVLGIGKKVYDVGKKIFSGGKRETRKRETKEEKEIREIGENVIAGKVSYGELPPVVKDLLEKYGYTYEKGKLVMPKPTYEALAERIIAGTYPYEKASALAKTELAKLGYVYKDGKLFRPEEVPGVVSPVIGYVVLGLFVAGIGYLAFRKG